MTTPRDMLIYKEQSTASRLAKKQWAEENLKLDYDDLPHWKELVSTAHVFRAMFTLIQPVST